MATITNREERETRDNVLNNLFAQAYVINWEVVAWTLILITAIFTRFYMLGDRVMSHDESLHTVFSNNLYRDGNYSHDPMMHGPILFHMTALSYFLFGVNDFTARIYPALLGVIIVVFPLLFRRWLGRTGAILAGVMLLASPLMMYYSRYIRHDMPSILSGMIMFWAAMMYLNGPDNQRRRAHWLYILAAAMLWNLGSKETAYIYIALFGAFLTAYWLTRVVQHYFRIDGWMVFATLMMGFLLAVVATLMMSVVLSISLAQYGTLDARLDFIGEQFGAIIGSDPITPAFSTFLSWTGLVIVSMLTVILGPAIWTYRKMRGKFEVPDALMLFAGMLLFIIFGIILTPEYVALENGVEVNVMLSAVALAVGLILALSFWLVYGAIRLSSNRPFGGRVALLLAVVVVSCAGLLFIEELSFEPSRVSEETPESQPVPGEAGGEVVLDGEVAAEDSGLRDVLIVINVLLTAGLLYALARTLQYAFALASNDILRRLPQLAVGALLSILAALPIVGLTIFIGMMGLSSEASSAFVDRANDWVADTLSSTAGIGFIASIVLLAGISVWSFTLRKDRFSLSDVFVIFIGGTMLLIGAAAVVPGEAVLVQSDIFGVGGETVSVSIALFATLIGHIAAFLFVTNRTLKRQTGTGDQRVAAWMAIAFSLITLVAFMAVEGLAALRNPVEARNMLAFIVVFWMAVTLLLGVLIEAKYRGWWNLLNPFPEFDVLIIMGALILPWLTAFVSRAAGTDVLPLSQIGEGIGVLSTLIPRDIPSEVGRIVVGFLAWLPMMTLAVVAGLLWNWKRFLGAFVIFHILFAFFFTTVFTNIEGLASGMVYGLDYWLEQQGVRRGGQPQYYYNLIILPFYEFLPIIGSVLAMIAGSVIFWRRSRVYDEDRAEHMTLAAEALNDEAARDDADAYETRKLADVEGDDEIERDPVDTMIEDEAREQGVWRSRWRLDYVPFLLFVGWWAVLNLFAYTLAGEKMPWLGTHMTVPMILLGAWYFGRVIECIDGETFRERGWIYLFVLPFLFVTMFQVIAPFLGGQQPFQGVSSQALRWTYGWLAVIALSAGLIYVVSRLVKETGWAHLRQMTALVSFVILAVITFRSAWIANFINYDEATEFLVYAHAAPGNEFVIDQVEELSLRTTDSYDIRILHDDRFSWPGSWYLRDFTNTLYIGSSTPSAQEVSNADVIIVGDSNRSKIEPLAEGQFQRFDHLRMWWPMQDYFGLTPTRINGLFNLEDNKSAGTRRGIFDIWWARDYSTYGRVTAAPDTPPERGAERFNVAAGNWPVDDTMHLYVRKDIVAQVWPYGLGDGDPTGPFTTITENVCSTNWQPVSASLVFGDDEQVQQPLGMAVSPEGNLYVAESLESASQISVFTKSGEFVESIGQFGGVNADGLFFNRPHSVAFGPEGNLYVVDTWNFKVRVFDRETLDQINSWGQVNTDGEAAQREPIDGFWGPRDILVDDNGYIYVSDTGNKRIRIYTSAGELLTDIGGAGSGDGELNEPVGITIAGDRLYVADTWNRRIAVFNIADVGSGLVEFVENVPIRGWYEEQGHRPYLAVDEARELLYVTDPDAGRVLVYDLDGECIGAFGQVTEAQPNDGEFIVVGGITVDDAGDVYVSDLTAERILKFPPFERPTEVTEGEQIQVEAVQPDAQDAQEQLDGGVNELEIGANLEATEEISGAIGE